MIKLTKDDKNNILFFKEFTQSKRFNKLCIFSHYDKDNIIDKYVIYMLKWLYKSGFEITFVSTSEKIRNSELQKISRYIRFAVIKKNIGYDFISWKTGLSFHKNYHQYETILHTNDSMFFPLFHPKIMFDKMKQKKLDFWGINDRYNSPNFIHSFFWVFNKRLIKDKFYKNFWNECKVIEDKVKLVRTYEAKFSPTLKKKGFKVGSYIKIEDIKEFINEKCKDYNTNKVFYATSYQNFWDILIRDFKAPYIKKNILCKSHHDFNIGTVFWEEFLKENTRFDTNIITRYLQRIQQEQDANKLNTFYNDLTNILLKLKKIENNKTPLSIYGYDQFGVFINSILKEKVEKIIDKNYNNINKRNIFFGVNSIIKSPNTIHKSDNIIITALNGKNDIIKYLKNMGIETDNINYFKDCTDIELINKNIVKLGVFLYYAYISNLKDSAKVSLIKTSNNLDLICQTFMQLNGLNPLPIIADKKYNDKIIFNIKYNETNDINLEFYIN